MNEYDSNRIYDSVKKIGFEKTEKYVEIPFPYPIKGLNVVWQSILAILLAR